MTRYTPALLGLLALAGPARAGDTDAPRPIPLTRPVMKQLLEDMKGRTPRIPLPPLTDDEKAKLGERGANYEGRLRLHYLPGGGEQRPANAADGQRGGQPGPGGSGGPADPAATLDGMFKTQLFWIVCRANNCQYCQGHQEGKLLRDGQTEDQIAALDGDWAEFTPAKRAAFAYARKITYEPHRLADADVAALKDHYTDAQVLEMTLSIAGNNQINRWKEGVGVPQGAGGGGGGRRDPNAPPPAAPPAKHTYVTPTSDKFKDAITKVAAVEYDAAGKPTTKTVSKRPPLEGRAEVESALTAAQGRKPRLMLADEARAREVAGDAAGAGPVPQWVRLMARFPVTGKNRIAAQRSAEDKGDLSKLLKAQVSWIVARQDRAWYATGEAKRRLAALGQTDDQITALDGDWAGFSPTERAMFTVAKKLAASPVVLTDADVAQAVKLAGPRDVVQLVQYVTVRASFGRITEAAGLTAESDDGKAPAAIPGTPSGDPKPVAATREEEKALLEAHKKARPRLPMPPPAGGDDPFSKVNNARFRAHYLPADLQTSGFSREPDPAMTLDNTFKVKLFWVTSRANNCYYCLGHQEHKLAGAGVSDDDIAALDGDWKGLPLADQAALRFTRKLALTPHLVGPEDVKQLGAHYTPAQVAEIVVTVAGYCSTNRWTDGLNIPAEDNAEFFRKGDAKADFSRFTTPTSAKFAKARSAVATLPEDAKSAAAPKLPARPPLESREEVGARWKAARARAATLPLADPKAAAELWGGENAPNWVRLLALFPKASKGRVANLKASMDKGNLSPRLKAAIAWAAAREDRAWYALAVARERLEAVGFSDDQVFALDGEANDLTDRERTAVAFARKLAVAPATVTDTDVEGLRKLFTDHEVAEVVYHACNAAFFDRATEAANLPLDQ
ncbi:MAG: carboxymuconolactone decarboxylase family protein [Gemmataceae bacterium]|nr:carboxymuconolactone decarboxylase family protein [Gemmataceae bacterium]